MKFIILSVATLLSTFILFSCKKDNPIPPEDQPQANLILEDVSCTEAWIKLSTNNVSLPADVELYKDNSLAETLSLANTDTLLYVDSLLPNQTYRFHTTIHSYNHTFTSDPLTVTTMDTTSHNFTWQTWTFGGQAGSCTLYDVAIINENDIWAVGEIYLLDTTGVPDPNAYNAVHWDGNQWELIRIKTNACGGVVYPPVRTVFAFSADNILFAHTDGSISYYYGSGFTNNCSLITQLNGSANKIWGMASNDFYVVSNNGFIAHNQNGQWSRIESGTNLDIYDIWGDFNEVTNNYEITTVAAEIGVGPDKEVLRIDNNGGVTSLPTNGIPYSIKGIWFKGKNCYVAGSGIYRKYDVNSSAAWTAVHQGISNYYIESIRGNGLNDIIACGAFGEVLHFNGVSWKSYIGITSINGSIGGDIKGNTICCYGFKDSQAIVIIGRR